MSAPRCQVDGRFPWQEPGSLWTSTDGATSCMRHIDGMQEALADRPRAKRHRVAGRDWRWVTPNVLRYLAEADLDRCPDC